MKLPKFSLGMGDRFGHQGKAQLQAVLHARDAGIALCPVWNKSNREHSIIKSQPGDVRAEADAAVAALGWDAAYFVDADHIGLKTVDGFIEASDFYTLDVADFAGQPAGDAAIDAFARSVSRYVGSLAIPGIDRPFALTADLVRAAARKFLLAAQEAGRIYRHVAARKGEGRFVTEVSVDETDTPQTPVELFLILAMLAGEGIPAQTVAPKFTGRFNKGVDYVGDLARFEQEFDEDLSVIAFAIAEFGLPETLKLSVHSGSDKFSIYPIIRRQIAKHGAGLHVKTAGTTWLEELIGLAEAGGDGLAIAREVYAAAHGRFDELTAPYSTVIAIDPAQLPSPAEVNAWDSARYVDALRHVRDCPGYNPHLRQLLHVGFKVAAEMKDRYTGALAANETLVARNVTHNLFDRHILPIFGQ